jgi:hypothetical protein
MLKRAGAYTVYFNFQSKQSYHPSKRHVDSIRSYETYTKYASAKNKRAEAELRQLQLTYRFGLLVSPAGFQRQRPVELHAPVVGQHRRSTRSTSIFPVK